MRSESLPHRQCRTVAAILLAAGALCALPPVALAQQAAQAQHVAVSGGGRTFGGLVLTSQAQPGDLEVRSQRATVWNEGETQRLLLRGDVRITLGRHSFAAEHATLWIERRPDGARQAAIYLARVGDPRGDAATVVQADRLLVTGVVLGRVALTTDLLEHGRPNREFVVEGERRMTRYVAAAQGTPVLVEPREFRQALVEGRAPGEPGPPLVTLEPRHGIDGDIPPAPPVDRRLPIAEQPPPRLPSEGVVTFHAPDISLVVDEGERALVLDGGVSIQQLDPQTGRAMQLTAQRAVAFFEPGDDSSDPLRASVGRVRGVYLEGDASATDGSYSVRGKQIYYDPRADSAIVLEGVFWTYDENRGMPLYVRAEEIRQVSQRQWEARDVRLTNTAFAEPHFAIGAEHVTVRRVPGAGGDGADAPLRNDRVLVDARSGALQIGSASLLPLPRYRGDLRNIPLRRVDIESRDGEPAVRTTWDIQALNGLEFSPDFRADLLLDAYLSRGPGVGVESEWSGAESAGSLFAYGVYDNGEDRLTSGAEIDRDNELRGIVLFEHIYKPTEFWTLFAEAAYASDEAFTDAFFPRIAESRREFVGSLYAKRLEDNHLLTFEVRAPLDNFSPNEYLLQTPGYQTSKLPEITYSRVAEDLFGGAVQYTSETGLASVSASFIDAEPEDIGLDTLRRSTAAFGIGPMTPLASRLRAIGLDEETVTRFDTRHEVTIPFKTDALSVVPFAVGRFTGYDQDFDDYGGGRADDNRFFGSLGVRAGATLTRVYDGVHSRSLDLHRLRHVIEPSVTVWYGESNVDQADLPTYDQRVESLSTGTAVRAGMVNTLQTYRGGPGRWYTVDWLTLRTDFVFASDDADRESPIGRWFDARPELSNMGDFFDTDAVLRVTNALALTGQAVYDFDESDLTFAVAGVLIDHGEGLRSFVETRYIEPLDSTLIDIGVEYALSSKYRVEMLAVFDAEESDLQSVGVEVARRFPQWDVRVAVGYDDITGDTSIAVGLTPAGLGGTNRSRSLMPAPLLHATNPALRLPGADVWGVQ